MELKKNGTPAPRIVLSNGVEKKKPAPPPPPVSFSLFHRTLIDAFALKLILETIVICTHEI